MRNPRDDHGSNEPPDPLGDDVLIGTGSHLSLPASAAHPQDQDEIPSLSDADIEEEGP